LLDEFKITPGAIGDALSTFYGLPYEPFRRERVKPIDLLKNLKRHFLEPNLWVPLEDTKEGLVVLTPDPERVRALRIVNTIFPKSRIVYRVCTVREFVATLEQFFGTEQDPDDENATDDISLAADNELVKLVNKIIIDAYQQGASDIHIEPYPGKGKTEIRFRKDGSLQPYISVPSSYRSAIATRLKIMCDLDISEKRKPQDGKIKFRKFGPLDIELRVATIPSQGGIEDIVMRILANGEPIPLDKLGLSQRNQKSLKE